MGMSTSMVKESLTRVRTICMAVQGMMFLQGGAGADWLDGGKGKDVLSGEGLTDDGTGALTDNEYARGGPNGADTFVTRDGGRWSIGRPSGCDYGF